MKKSRSKINKSYIYILLLFLMVISRITVTAHEYHQKTVSITPNLNLIVSVLADYKDGVYKNVIDAKLFFDGVSDFTIRDEQVTTTRIDESNYKVSYNFVVVGEKSALITSGLLKNICILDTLGKSGNFIQKISGSVMFQNTKHQLCYESMCNF